jgi:hypothetical protein
MELVNGLSASPQSRETGTFWVDADLETLLSGVAPSGGPADFAIDNLTDDEWERFVAAIEE